MEELFFGLPLWLNFGVVLFSLVILAFSSEWLIDGATAVAEQANISPLLIGSTVVAMGTSLAELVINLVEIFSPHGHVDAILGNVLGSNLVNLGVGLGISAVVATITTHVVVLEKEIPLYLAVMAMFTSFVADRRLAPLEGWLMVGAFVVMLVLLYQYCMREVNGPEGREGDEQYSHEEHVEHMHEERPATRKSILMILGGLVFLVVSARLLVGSGSAVASALGVSKYIIGLTIVGIGTSFPEVASSIQAARKGYTDIVLGNVFGSNIFNICFGLGLPVIFKPVDVASGILRDIYFVNIFGVLLVFILLIEARIVGDNKTLDRLGGLAVVGMYVLFVGSKIFPV